MLNGQTFHSDAEEAIARQLGSVQQRAAKMWEGYEQQGLTAIVRALDSVAAAGLMDSERSLSERTESARYFGLRGAASALRPFLEKVGDIPGGVPWGPSNADFSNFAYAYIITCGQLVHLLRLARLERYGLSKTTMGPKGPVIELEVGVEEIAQRFAMQASSTAPMAPLGCDRSRGQDRRLRRRMASYVDSVDNWFIRYDNDMDIVRTYRRRAVGYGAGFLEGEALADTAIVGDRTFAEWKDACNQALGRVLCHIDFTHALKRKRPGIALGNVTTIFVRKDDIEDVWTQAGLQEDRVGPTMRALTLQADGIDAWERDFEVPCPFYVEMGRDFLLLPCFGALVNPYFALFRHLRTAYRRDWDRAVDKREELFRHNLAAAFRSPRYCVPDRGFKIRRSDGSLLTDIDAVIVDARSGSLALVQLKWNDVFGYSLSERESRRKNILAANEWVERVNSWINGRSAAAVAQELGIGGANSTAPPLLYVVARYTARFSSEAGQDPRAAWIGWHEILHVQPDLSEADPLIDLPQAVVRHQARFVLSRPLIETFSFSDLSVELRTLPRYYQ